MSQPSNVYPYVDDPDQAIADGFTDIRLYRDTNPAGTFATLVDTDTLVAGTRTYTISDPTGSPAYVYRTTLFGAGPGETELSPVIYADQASLLQILLQANRRTAAGWDSTATSNGSNTALIDSVLGNTAVDASFGQGLWIYRYNAGDANKLRRVKRKGYTVASKTFQPSVDWTDGGPQAGEAYAVFHYYPPIATAGESYSWAQAVRDGLEEFRQRPLLNAGLGDGTRTRWDLTAYGVRNVDDIANVYVREFFDTTNYRDYDASKNGRWWEPQNERPGLVSVRVNPPLSASQYLMVEADVPFAKPYRDQDVSDCPFELAVAATRWAIFRQLNRYNRPGKYSVEENSAWEDALATAIDYGAFSPSNILGD